MRERLTERVSNRLVERGNPELAARVLAVQAVDNYYNQTRDEWSDLVAAEACREFADHLMLRAPRMAEAWEHLSQAVRDLDHMKSLFTGAAMSLGVDDQRNALRSTLTAVADMKGVAESLAAADEARKALWGAVAPGTEDALYPEDVITGFEDGCHIVNGDPNSCACPKHLAGHSVTCEVRLTPGWEHAATLCNVTRTNCTHGTTTRSKHTYGQACKGDETPAEVYTGHALDCSTQGGHAGTDCHKLRPTCFHNTRHVYGERCPR